MKDGSSLKEYLDDFNSILMDLKNVEVKIEDEDAALVLLVSLPHSFESFVSSLLSVKTLSLWRRLDLVCIQKSFVNKRRVVVMSLNPWISRDRGRYRFKKGKDKGGASSSSRASTAKDDSCYSGSECKDKGGTSSSSRGPNPRDICNYCKETGHWKIDCSKLKEKCLVVAIAKNDSCYSGSECDLL
nr:retrovirus-related Pol polyprotein from transposon TNT 1-94 [Tanacetum cinerariifolium]